MEGSYVWGVLCAAGSGFFFLHSVARRRLSTSRKAIRVTVVVAVSFLFIFTISKLETPSAFSDFEFWLGVISIPTNLIFYFWVVRKYRLEPKLELGDNQQIFFPNSKWNSKQLRKLIEFSWLAKMMKFTLDDYNHKNEPEVFENSIQKVFYYAFRRFCIFALSILISSFALETYFALMQTSTYSTSPLEFDVFTREVRALPCLLFFASLIMLCVDIETLQRIRLPRGYSEVKFSILLYFLMVGLNVAIITTQTNLNDFNLSHSLILVTIWANLVVAIAGLLLGRSNRLMLSFPPEK
jgi:hypothetical protein